MSDDAKLKEAAEKYATGNYRASFPDTCELNAFIAGAEWSHNQPCLCNNCRGDSPTAKERDSLRVEVKRLHDKYDHQLLVQENARLRDLLERCRDRLDDSHLSDDLWCLVNEAFQSINPENK